LIFVLGGGVGLAFASGGVNGLLAIAPTNIPRITGAGVQMAEFAFALTMAVVAGLGFGMYPALKARSEDPSRGLREGTGSSEPRGTGRFRRALVVVEVALSVILLVGAGLMIRSLGAMNSNDPGFRVDHLVTFGVTPPVSRYPDANDAHLFFDRVTDRFAALPGVQSASTTTWVPIGGGGIGLGRVHLADDMPEPPAGPDYSARWVMVGPDLFNTLAWPLQRGRAFTDADNAEGPQVAIINEVMADRMFPGESPIGKRVRSWRDENVYREIVGVVGNVRLDAVADNLQPLFLVPAKQVSWARSRSIVLRSAVDPTTLLPQLQGALSDVDPLVPVTNPRTGEILFDASLAASRFTTMLLSLFAVLAAVVAAIGLYGVIASTVTNRTKELGIRTALGSGRRRTMALVMGQGLRLAAVGAALGLVVSLLLTGAMTGMLFQVSARDPLTFAGITGGILLVALVASYVPAARAMRVDPVRALREE
jgi:predicted permease